VHRFGQGSKKSPSAECPGFVSETWEPISEKLVLIEALVEGLDGPYTYDSMLRIHSMDYPPTGSNGEAGRSTVEYTPTRTDRYVWSRSPLALYSRLGV
jgi:hypothetical protein